MFTFVVDMNPDVFFLVGVPSSSIRSFRFVFACFCFAFAFFSFYFFFAPILTTTLRNIGHLTHTSLPYPHARRELAPEQDHTQRQKLLSTVAGMFFYPFFCPLI